VSSFAAPESPAASLEPPPPAAWLPSWRGAASEPQAMAAAGDDARDGGASAPAGGSTALAWPRGSGPPQPLPHPAPLLALAWRPPAPRRVLLSFAQDGVARLWGSAPAAAGCAPRALAPAARPRLALLLSLPPSPARDVAGPPCWCGIDALAAPAEGGAVGLWSLWGLDAAPPAAAPRAALAARAAPGFLPPRAAAAGGARLLLRLVPADVSAPARAWGLGDDGRAWAAEAALWPAAAPPPPQPARAPLPMPGHAAEVVALAAPPDADGEALLASADAAGGARLWLASPDGALRAAGALLGDEAESCDGYVALLAATAPSVFAFALGAPGGVQALQAFSLRGGRRRATLLQAAGIAALAALPGGPGGEDCGGRLAALLRGGGEVRCWALAASRAGGVEASPMAAVLLSRPAALLAAPPAAPRGPSLFATVEVEAPRAVRLWSAELADGDGDGDGELICLLPMGPGDSDCPLLLALAPGAHLAAACAGGGAPLLLYSASPALGGRWRSEPLPQPATQPPPPRAAAWLAGGAAPPLLAAAFADGSLLLYCRCGGGGGFSALARLPPPPPPAAAAAALAWLPGAGLVLARGAEVVGLSPLAVAGGSACTLPLLAHDAAGARPAWHPETLSELLRCGGDAAATRIVRHLAQWLEDGAPMGGAQPPLEAARPPHFLPAAEAEAGVAARAAGGAASFAPGAVMEEAMAAAPPARPFSAAEAEACAGALAAAPPRRLAAAGLPDASDGLFLLRCLDSLAKPPPPPAARALDAPAQQALLELRAAGLAGAGAAAAAAARARAAAWAAHSAAPEALLAAAAGGGGWPALSAASAPLWLPSAAALRAACEAAARAAYLSRRRAEDAAPLYCALGRYAVLSALYKSEGDRQMPAFLSRDFAGCERARQAASKNAFALLAKNRPLLASAFFSLAGAPRDAASVVLRRCGDAALAMAIARLADGGGEGDRLGPLARQLAEEELLPAAAAAADAAGQHALLWRLGRRDEAVRAVVAACACDAPLRGLAEEAAGARMLAHLARGGGGAAAEAAGALAGACARAAAAAEAARQPLLALHWLAAGGVAPARGVAARLAAAALARAAAEAGGGWREAAAEEAAALALQAPLTPLPALLEPALARWLALRSPPAPASAAAPPPPPPRLRTPGPPAPSPPASPRTPSRLSPLFPQPSLFSPAGLSATPPGSPSRNGGDAGPLRPAPIDLLRQPGELLRSAALLCGGRVLAAAALRRGLLVHAAEGSCERARLLARCAAADGPPPAPRPGPPPPWAAGGGAAGLADWRCLAAHPEAEGVLAAGGAAGAPPAAALQIWSISPDEPPSFLASLGAGAGFGPPGAGGGGGLVALCWEEGSGGGRLAAAAADGRALLWRCGGGSAPVGSLAAFPGGTAGSVAFLSPTLLLLGGSGEGGCLSLWDSLCPPRAARVALFDAHAGGLGSAAAAAAPPPLPACVVWSVGAERGDVAAFDLRAAASAGASAPLWRAPGSHGGAAGACLAAWNGWVAVGDRGGELRLLDARTGRAAQALNAHSRSSFALRGGGGALSAGVTHLLPLPHGLLSAGADGVLRLWCDSAAA